MLTNQLQVWWPRLQEAAKSQTGWVQLVSVLLLIGAALCCVMSLQTQKVDPAEQTWAAFRVLDFDETATIDETALEAVRQMPLVQQFSTQLSRQGYLVSISTEGADSSRDHAAFISRHLFDLKCEGAPTVFNGQYWVTDLSGFSASQLHCRAKFIGPASLQVQFADLHKLDTERSHQFERMSFL
ncbi:MAG: hypothetical protein R3194_06430, partial [Limnobacter sp.]|nr:hypothetical protein [Limnobacter sp.]